MLASTDKKDEQPKWVEELLQRKRTLYKQVISDPAIQERYVVTTTEPWKSPPTRIGYLSERAKAEFHGTGKHSVGERSFQPLLPSTTSRGPSGQATTSAGNTSSSAASKSSVRNVKQMHIENQCKVMMMPGTARNSSYSSMREYSIQGHKEVCKNKNTSERDTSQDRFRVSSPASNNISPISSSHFMDKDENELVWGPGIVNKLKSKFVSEIENNNAQEYIGNRKLMADVEVNKNLRQSIKVTTSTTTSEKAYFVDNKTEKNSVKHDNFTISRGNSVLSDTAKPLQRNHKPKQTNHRRSPLVKNLYSIRGQVSSSVLINEKAVIIEHSAQARRSGQCSPNASTQEENRNNYTFNLSDDNFCKRDTVRTYKQILELPTNSINSYQQMKIKRQPIVKSEVENITSLCPVTLIVTPSTQPQKELLDKSVTKRTNDIYCQKSRVVKLEPHINDVTVSFKQQDTSKRSPSVTCHEGKTNTNETKENSKDISSGHLKTSRELEDGVTSVSSEALERIRSQGSTMVFGGKRAPLVKPRPNQRSTRRTKKTKSPSVPKQEVSSNLKIPAGSSTTKNADIATVTTVSPATKYQSKETLKPRENEPSATEPITGKVEKFPDDVKEHFSTLHSTKHPDVSRNQQEEKVIGEVLRSSALLGNKASLWPQKPSSNKNTMVFDFRGKDVQPNVALQHKLWCTSSSHAFQKKIQLTNGNSNGIMIDGNFGESREYEDEEYAHRETEVGMNLSLVSGLAFIGENTRVGKSAFLTARNKKLTIQFDEEPTIFTYPVGTSHIQDNLEVSPGYNLLDKDSRTQISTEINGVTGL